VLCCEVVGVGCCGREVHIMAGNQGHRRDHPHSPTARSYSLELSSISLRISILSLQMLSRRISFVLFEQLTRYYHHHIEVSSQADRSGVPPRMKVHLSVAIKQCLWTSDKALPPGTYYPPYYATTPPPHLHRVHLPTSHDTYVANTHLFSHSPPTTTTTSASPSTDNNRRIYNPYNTSRVTIHIALDRLRGITCHHTPESSGERA